MSGLGREEEEALGVEVSLSGYNGIGFGARWVSFLGHDYSQHRTHHNQNMLPIEVIDAFDC